MAIPEQMAKDGNKTYFGFVGNNFRKTAKRELWNHPNSEILVVADKGTKRIVKFVDGKARLLPIESKIPN